MRKINQCIICSNKKIQKVGDFIQGMIHFSIVRCTGCNLYFQNPMPTKKELMKLYEDIYNKKNNLPCAEAAFEKKDIKRERGRIKEIERYRTTGRIMDYGASTGFFLSELGDKWEKYGIEYSKQAVKIAQQQFGLHILHGGMEQLRAFPARYFDIITMHSVFEHLDNPDEALRDVGKKLKNGGMFIFNVPNMHSFEYTLFKSLRKDFPGFIFEHTYYYNSRNITQLLSRHGFFVELISSKHHETFHFPPKRPIIGWITAVAKLLLEYTSFGGKLKKGNIIYVYAKKTN